MVKRKWKTSYNEAERGVEEYGGGKSCWRRRVSATARDINIIEESVVLRKVVVGLKEYTTTLHQLLSVVSLRLWPIRSNRQKRKLQGTGPAGRVIATGLGREPVEGCYSAEMGRPAIRSTAHDPILSYCPACGAFDHGLAVSVPLPIVMGIFVLLWFKSRLT